MPHLDCIPVPPLDPKIGNQKQPLATAQQHNVNSKRTSGGKVPAANKGPMCVVTEESLSPLQKDKLAELRALLGEQLLNDTPLFNDTFSLLRWLTGWNNKIEEIVPRFKRASSVFRCMRINQLQLDDVDELNAYTRTVTSAADYFPGGVLGFDRDGNVVAMQCMGKSHPKQLSKCGRVSDVYRLGVTETALIHQLIRQQERKWRRKLGLRVVIDLEGFNMDHLSTMALKVYANMLSTMQELFPDLLRQVYVINAHYLVKTAYNIIKPVLSEQSREKVVFLDHAFQETLARDIGPENLFPRWGGTRTPGHGHPEWGTLRVGGIPPPELRYCPAKNPLHVEEATLQKLWVPARQRRELEVEVPAEGEHYTLRWFFHSNGDVAFGVLTQDDLEVWPVFHLLTDHVPEFGSARVEGGRRYKLVFDNTFGTFFSREIKYGVRVERAGADEEKKLKESEEEQEGTDSGKENDAQ